MKNCRWCPGISSWWTVAREKWMLFAFRLMSLSASSIVSVGNETMIRSPPRKNGFTFCAWADIMSIGQSSLASSGIVTRLFFSTKSIASFASSRTSCGCSPGFLWSVLTFSKAFFQSSPKPISFDAFFISASHQANSRSAILRSSSGV